MLRRCLVFPVFLCVGMLALNHLHAQTGQETIEYEGELTSEDRVHSDSGSYIDDYEVELESGMLLVISMECTDDSGLDTVLHLTGPSGQELRNDDSYEFNGSRITTVVSEQGVWEIGAAGLHEDSEGAYKVTIETAMLEEMLSERGSLEESDGRLLKFGEYYDLFEIEVEDGKTYVVNCVSTEFDTFLAADYPGGHAYNDDIDSSYNKSMIVFKPEESGKAKIIMTSCNSDATGRYRLNVFQVDK